MRHPSNQKKFIALLALLLFLPFVAAPINAQEASKIDEVVNPRCDLSEVPQITDPPPTGIIFAALDEKREAKAAIIVYGMQGQARRYAKNVVRWLSEVRGIDAKRLVALYGGPSDVLRLELWLVPKGAPLPQVKPDEDDQHAAQFDTYSYRNEEYCGGDRFPALNELAAALKQRHGWRGYIVVRPHKNSRGIRAGDAGWDPDGYISRQQAFDRAAKDKRYLVIKSGLSPTRLKAVVGDNDEWTHAELWLVPPGAEPPATKRKISISRK
jgi:hypothetical protein